MRIHGFNYIGKYVTTSTADNDAVHVIYALDNNLLYAICRSRFKRDRAPWYIAYGLNPLSGIYVTRHIHEFPERFETYADAKRFLEEAFAHQHPEILVNNHIADRIANVYSQWVTKPRNGETAVDRWGRVRRVLDTDMPLMYHPPAAHPGEYGPWSVSRTFKAEHHADSDQFDSYEQFLRSCHDHLAAYSQNVVGVHAQLNNGDDEYMHRLLAASVPALNYTDAEEILKYLENTNNFAGDLSDPNA